MVKILIVSDLHAYSPSQEEGRREPSFLIASEKSREKYVNPLRQIPAALEQAELGVDWILCPGDIADQADPDAQTFVWNELLSLQQAVKAKLLLGTVGNHDIDSRLKFSSFDPKGHLQSLSPRFPGIDNSSDKYWARNYHLYEQGKIRLLSLNSAAFHGFHSGDPKTEAEYRHGRVSERTIDQIVCEVKKKTFEHNILLTHHHPYKNDEIYSDDYSEMLLGGKLVSAISDATSSSWLIIHGHLHYPLLKYGFGSAFEPVIFSAGSISAKISSPLSDEAPNQFYHVTLETDKVKTNGWGPCGLVRAWSWSRRREWRPTPHDQNIPDGTGFGCRDNIPSIAKAIAEVVSNHSTAITFRDLYKLKPHLQFVMQRSLSEAIKSLEGLGVRCTPTTPFADSQFRKLAEAK